MLSKKIILTGNFGVGKTAILQSYISNSFRQNYSTTIGLRVEQKIDTSAQQDALLIWDIGGEICQTKVPNSYFLGTDHILYVIDLTRPSTYNDISNDITYLKTISPDTTISIIGNKIDLVDDLDLATIIQTIPYTIDKLTSAKTGKNIEALFDDLYPNNSIGKSTQQTTRQVYVSAEELNQQVLFI